MRVVLTPHGWEDHARWQTADRTKHRLAYLIDGDDLLILQARFHDE